MGQKIIACGDFHLRTTKPKCRLDDYLEAQLKKLGFISKLSYIHNAIAIIQPGDLCDYWAFPDSYKTFWMGKFRSLNFQRLICVPGQHDMRYHTSDIMNTPLGVLSEGVPFKAITSDQPFKIGKNVSIYGAGWGNDIPRIKDPSATNILITHRMIVMEKLWGGQKDYEVAGTFMRSNKFDIVISGDNHSSFEYEQGKRLLLNAGSLMRSRTDQFDHRPCAYVVDIESLDFDKVYIPIEKSSEVIDLSYSEKESQEKDNERMRILSSSLKMSGDEISEFKSRVDFSKRVKTRVSDLKGSKKITKGAENIVSEIMEG